MLEVPAHPVHRKLQHHRVLGNFGTLDIHLDRVSVDRAQGDALLKRYVRYFGLQEQIQHSQPH